MKLIPAIKKDQDLLDEIDSFQQDTENLHLWWLGQSGFLVQWKGARLLLDPYLSDSLTRKYEGTSKPHVRMSERVIDPNVLKGIKVVTSSHNHTDHLDKETLVPVLHNNPGIHFIIPEANRAFVVERIGCAIDFPIGINDGQEVTVGPFSIYAIPAKHNEITRDAQGHCHCLGYVIRVGSCSLYHSGDTLYYEEMVALLQPFQIDIALLPINGNDPSRGVAGNLNAKEAVQLSKDIGAACLIPCHYHMFTFNSVEPEECITWAQSFAQPCTVLSPGGHWSTPCN
jgi:L-ascorbate metabolism protein UlaG (beta-lactamase superfamily)